MLALQEIYIVGRARDKYHSPHINCRTRLVGAAFLIIAVLHTRNLSSGGSRLHSIDVAVEVDAAEAILPPHGISPLLGESKIDSAGMKNPCVGSPADPALRFPS